MSQTKRLHSSISRSVRRSSTRLTFSSVRAMRRRPLPGLRSADPVLSILCSRRFTEAREQFFFLRHSATNLLAHYFLTLRILNKPYLLFTTFSKSYWKRKSVTALWKKCLKRKTSDSMKFCIGDLKFYLIPYRSVVVISIFQGAHFLSGHTVYITKTDILQTQNFRNSCQKDLHSRTV